MSFLETPRFPDNIAYGASAGPEFQTRIILVNSGHESRNVNWSQARARFDVGHKGRTQADTDALIAFFRAVKGRAHGFRFKDWTDHHVSLEQGSTSKLPGLRLQLQKTYRTGTLNETRRITKPVPGTVEVQRNGIRLSLGTAPGQIQIDASSGILSITEDRRVAIAQISNSDPGVVTTFDAHGLNDGDVIDLITAAGMRELNQAITTISLLSSKSFAIDIDTTDYAVYSSGGFALRSVQPNESLSWQGEFDVPCRFDTDQMQIEIIDKGIYSWGQIPLVEIRT